MAGTPWKYGGRCSPTRKRRRLGSSKHALRMTVPESLKILQSQGVAVIFYAWNGDLA